MNRLMGKLVIIIKHLTLNELSTMLGIARETISVYLNTYVPYRKFVFLTNKIEFFDLASKLINEAMQGLNLNHNKPKNLLMY